MAVGSTAPGHADTERHVAAIRELLELRDWLLDWREDDAAGLYEIISILDDAEGKLERAAAALAAAEQGRQEAEARVRELEQANAALTAAMRRLAWDGCVRLTRPAGEEPR